MKTQQRTKSINTKTTSGDISAALAPVFAALADHESRISALESVDPAVVPNFGTARTADKTVVKAVPGDRVTIYPVASPFGTSLAGYKYANNGAAVYIGPFNPNAPVTIDMTGYDYVALSDQAGAKVMTFATTEPTNAYTTADTWEIPTDPPSTFAALQSYLTASYPMTTPNIFIQ